MKGARSLVETVVEPVEKGAKEWTTSMRIKGM